MFARFIHRILVLIISFSLIGCFTSDYEVRTFYAMGTFLSINIKKSDMAHLNSVIDYINGISDNITKDELNVANADVNEEITVGADFMSLLNISNEFAVRSGGVYDPTISTITNLYGFGKDKYTLPNENTINNAKSAVGYNNLIIIDNNTIKKTTPLEIHFGAVGKGYIADKAANYLSTLGVSGFVINIGGDMIVSGNKGESPFNIGITNPAKPNTVIAVINVENKGVATSGNYERSFKDSDGNLINHIFNSKTGNSINNYSSISVITDNATLADIYATYYYTQSRDNILLDCTKNDIPVMVINLDNSIEKMCNWDLYEKK